MIVRRSGKLRRKMSCAGRIVSSSPGWVCAARKTGRDPIACRNAASFSASAGSAGPSALRLPITRTSRAPRARNRAAISSSCERQTSNAERSVRAVAGAQRQLLYERSDMRALTSARRTPRSCAPSIRFGPKIGIDKQPDLRLPIIEKARGRHGRVDGNKLMDGARGQALAHDLGQGNRAAGDDHAAIAARE